MNNWLKIFYSLAFAVLAPAAALAGLGKLGAMGDSLSDEYWDDHVSTYATNWTILLVNFRGIDMGPTAAQAGTNTWGSPRNAGYKYNWALGGATSATLLSEGQHTGLREQVASDGVSNAVLEIGANDFNPSSSAYLNIYNGSWTASQIQSYVNQTLSNIEVALATVRTSGVSMVIASVLDPGAAPVSVSFFPNGTQRDRVAAAVQSVNTGIKNLGQKYQVPVMDWYALEKAILGPNTNLYQTLKVGNVTMNLRASDPGPPNSAPTNAFVADGFHPNTTMQGIFANTIIQAFNSGYNAGLALFTESEILQYALIPYGGADTLQSQIGSYTNYIILPVLPQFRGINVYGTDVALEFTTVANQSYLVESRDDLVSSSWAVVSNNVPGTGNIITLTNQVPPNLPRRFYRVRQLP